MTDTPLRRADRPVERQPVERARSGACWWARPTQHPLIRELSTSPEHEVAVGRRTLQYRNTNGLVRNPSWEIGLQKTGYISEAGRCLVMQAQMAGRKLIMVFLDSRPASTRGSATPSACGTGSRPRCRADARPLGRPGVTLLTRASAASSDGASSRLGRAAPGGRARPRSAPRWPCRRSSQASSSRSAGAEIDSPAISLPWSSWMPAAMQRTPSSSSSLSRALPLCEHLRQLALEQRRAR